MSGMWKMFQRPLWNSDRTGSRREVVAGASSSSTEVGAGEVLTVEVRVVPETARISWTFSTESRDIGFDATFHTWKVSEDGETSSEGDVTTTHGEHFEVVPYGRVDSHVLPQHGSFLNEGWTGRLVLTFDNTFSHYWSKHLSYAVSTEKELDVGSLRDSRGLRPVRTPFGPAELLRWREPATPTDDRFAVVAFPWGGRGFLHEDSVSTVHCRLVRTMYELERIEACRALLRTLLRAPPPKSTLSRWRSAANASAARVSSALVGLGGSAKLAMSGAARMAAEAATRASLLVSGGAEGDQQQEQPEQPEQPEQQQQGEGAEGEPEAGNTLHAGAGGESDPKDSGMTDVPLEMETDKSAAENTAEDATREEESTESSEEDEKQAVVIDLSGRERLISDLWIARFLRLQNWDAHKAAQAIADTLRWRVLDQQPGALRFADIERTLGVFHCFLGGRDVLGRPVCVVRATSNAPINRESKLSALLFALERVCAQAQVLEDRRQASGEQEEQEATESTAAGAGGASAEAGGASAEAEAASPEERKPAPEATRKQLTRRGRWGTDDVAQMTLIIDFKDFRRHDMDITLARTFARLFQTHYPGTMGLCVVYNTPTTFDVLWRALSPFLSPRLLQRVVLLRGEDNEETIERLRSLLPRKSLHRVLEEYPNFDQIRASDAYGSPWGEADAPLTEEEAGERMIQALQGGAKGTTEEDEGFGEEGPAAAPDVAGDGTWV